MNSRPSAGVGGPARGRGSQRCWPDYRPVGCTGGDVLPNHVGAVPLSRHRPNESVFRRQYTGSCRG
jgi:hypothetical protein